LLRTVCDALDLAKCPGAGAVANPMSDFFVDVKIDTPFPNAKVASPVQIKATTSNGPTVTAMQIYVDGALKYQVKSNSVNTRVPMGLGKHHVVVQSLDRVGGIHRRKIDASVQSQAVVVKSPAPNAIVGPSVPVAATGDGQNSVTKMQLYLDGYWRYVSSGNALNTSVSLGAGNHTLSVEATDSAGNLTTTKLPVTSASPKVRILSPAPNSSLPAPMYISANTVDPDPVLVVQIYVDNALVYEVSGSGVQAWLPIKSGSHRVVVRARNKAGATYQKGIAVNVQ
jgi:hypothetical protein